MMKARFSVRARSQNSNRFRSGSHRFCGGGRRPFYVHHLESGPGSPSTQSCLRREMVSSPREHLIPRL